jgi:hypothetical protein
LVPLDDFRRWTASQTDDWETEHAVSAFFDGTISGFKAIDTSLIPRYGQVVPRLYDAEELEVLALREAFSYCSIVSCSGSVGLTGLQY